MLTVNHTTSCDNFVTQRIIQVRNIKNQTPNSHFNQSPDTPGMFDGVILVLSDGTEEIYNRYDIGGPDIWERFYVMNDHGKTIATYQL